MWVHDPGRAMTLPDALIGDRAYVRRGVAIRGETIRVILADDHAMVREGLRLVLRAAPDIVVIGEAGEGAATVELVRRLRPSLVILDLDMPGADGLAVVRDLARMSSPVPALILTVHAEHERLVALLEAGARGYLTKESASRDLIEAIRVVAAGDVYVRPTTARLLATAVVPQRVADSAHSRFHRLSHREQMVVRLIAQGYSGVEMARRLAISTKTIDAYKRRIREKIGLDHRTAYVRFAVEAGLLD